MTSSHRKTTPSWQSIAVSKANGSYLNVTRVDWQQPWLLTKLAPSIFRAIYFINVTFFHLTRGISRLGITTVLVCVKLVLTTNMCTDEHTVIRSTHVLHTCSFTTYIFGSGVRWKFTYFYYWKYDSLQKHAKRTSFRKGRHKLFPPKHIRHRSRPPRKLLNNVQKTFPQ
jgi:hypothetical protein